MAQLPSHEWLRGYAALSAKRHRWWVSAVSAYLGALSHRLRDMVTHASIDRGTVRIAWLSTEVADQPWWRVLHYGSTVVGAAAVVVVVVHIGRTNWLLADGRVARVPAREPVWFWGVAAAVLVPALAIQPMLAWHDQPQVIIVRLSETACAPLLAGAAVATFAARRGAPTGAGAA